MSGITQNYGSLLEKDYDLRHRYVSKLIEKCSLFRVLCPAISYVKNC